MVVMVIGILAFVCVTCDIKQNMQQGIDCYSLRCDLVKVPEKTSGLEDTGAS